MECEYEYYPAEREVRWGDYPHPGSPAGTQVLSCVVGGVNIVEMLVDSQHEAIEEALLKEHEG